MLGKSSKYFLCAFLLISGAAQSTAIINLEVLRIIYIYNDEGAARKAFKIVKMQYIH